MHINSRIEKFSWRLKDVKNNAFVFSSVFVAVALPFSVQLTTKAILLMVVAWILQNNFKKLLAVLKTDKRVWVFGGLYLLMAVSMIYTANFRSGMWELEKTAGLLVFPVMLASAKPFDKQQVYFIVKSFVFSNICFGIICLVYAAYVYRDSGTNIFFHHELVKPLFNSHATYYSLYVLFSLVAVLFFYNEQSNPTVTIKIATAAIVFFFSVLIYLLSVRSMILLYSVAVVITIGYYIIKTKNLKVGTALLVAFGIFVWLIVKNNPVLVSRLLEIAQNHEYEMSENTMEGYNGFTTRLAQWESSLAIIKRHPVIGVAPGDVQDELQVMYKQNYLKYCYENKWNAHNEYIQMTLGLGVIGLFIFVNALFITGRLAYQQRDVLSLAFIVVFVYCSITESTLCVQKGVIFYSFFQSLFVFHLMRKPSERTLAGEMA
jgi:O-antigen ligase